MSRGIDGARVNERVVGTLLYPSRIGFPENGMCPNREEVHDPYGFFLRLNERRK